MKCRTKCLLTAVLVTLSTPFFLAYLHTEEQKVSRMNANTFSRHDGLGGRRTLEETKQPASITTPTAENRAESETTSTEVPSSSEGSPSVAVTTSAPTPSEGSPSESAPSPEELRKMVESINAKEVLLNADRFASLQNEDVVFIVQVHRRLHYLQSLIDSLRKAAGIDRVLLVFSHDYMDGEINKLIQSIDFCKVWMGIGSVGHVCNMHVHVWIV